MSDERDTSRKDLPREPDDSEAMGPAGEQERRAAQKLAEALEGRSAGGGDDEGVVEAALMIRASHHPTALGDARRDALLDAAFAEAGQSQSSAARGGAQSSGGAGVTDLAAARERRARRVSSMRRAGSLLALAAALLIVVGAVFSMRTSDREAPPPARHAATSVSRGAVDAVASTQRARRVLSRPSDDLLGRPIAKRERAAAASRLDRVFADRMAGYRQLALARSTP